MSISGIGSVPNAMPVSLQTLRNKFGQGVNPVSVARQAPDIVRLTNAQTSGATSTTGSGTSFLRSLVQFGLNFLK
jgi:hypothetical protein